ncbi:hypothetical protein ACOSQ3_021363 [Xanthoceras sorbifolium]
MSTSFSAGSGENVNDSASNLNPMSLDRKHSRWKRLARKGTVSPGGMALQPSSVMNLVLGSVRPHVTPSINGFLDAKFSGEEIRQALFQTAEETVQWAKASLAEYRAAVSVPKL